MQTATEAEMDAHRPPPNPTNRNQSRWGRLTWFRGFTSLFRFGRSEENQPAMRDVVNMELIPQEEGEHYVPMEAYRDGGQSYIPI